MKTHAQRMVIGINVKIVLENTTDRLKVKSPKGSIDVNIVKLYVQIYIGIIARANLNASGVVSLILGHYRSTTLIVMGQKKDD
jgi:hypothetical protein